MNKELLSEYGVREREENQKTIALAKTHFEAGKIYYKSRYTHLKAPVGWFAPFESIWPQIPPYGTLIIELMPIAAERFAAYHGFDISDIDQLIDFARGTGRIGFVLGGHRIV